MKLIKRGDIFYLYYDRRTSRSLKTSDRPEARRILKQEKERLKADQVRQVEKCQSIRLSDFRAEYLKHLDRRVLIDEISINTFKGYRTALNKLIEIVGDISMRQVFKHVDKFKHGLLTGAGDIEKSKASANNYIIRLGVAFNYAMAGDESTGRAPYLDDNPFAEKPGRPSIKFTLTKRLPKYLELAEIGSLFSALDADVTELQYQVDQAVEGTERRRLATSLDRTRTFRILLVFYLYTGMRRSEPLSLDWQDVKLADGFIHLRHTKTKEERLVPIPAALMQAIEELGPRPSGALFDIGDPSVLSHRFKSLARRVGIPENKTLHSTRHSFGTFAIEGGMDLDVLMEILGHSSLATTQIYKTVRAERLKAQADCISFEQLPAESQTSYVEPGVSPPDPGSLPHPSAERPRSGHMGAHG